MIGFVSSSIPTSFTSTGQSAPITARLRSHVAAKSCSSRVHRTALSMKRLSDEEKAEATRKALAESSPQVKFRRRIEDVPEDQQGFAYQSGVSSGVDVWLWSTFAAVLVPALIFAIGINNGWIDIPRR